MQSVRAMRGPGKSVDVIFVVDNSASMEDEIAAVRANINQNFAAIVQASAVDLRVILLSLYGTSGTNICIGPPLAGAECGAGLGLGAPTATCSSTTASTSRAPTRCA